MIGYIRGKINNKSDDSVILDVGGVGYRLFLSKTCMTCLPKIGEEATLHTYLHVREDIMHLFGFADEIEKTMFERLISVDKIGPKMAMTILSAFPVQSLQMAIISGDIDLLTTIPGIGKKGAQRIVLELREKMDLDEFDLSPASIDEVSSAELKDAKQALKALGYSPSEIAKAISVIGTQKDLDLQGYVKLALKELSK